MGSYREHLAIANPDDPRLVRRSLTSFEEYYLWVFGQINRCRRYEQGYPHQLGLEAFIQYQQLYGDPLDIDEILLLQILDTVFVNALNKNKEQ